MQFCLPRFELNIIIGASRLPLPLYCISPQHLRGGGEGIDNTYISACIVILYFKQSRMCMSITLFVTNSYSFVMYIVNILSHSRHIRFHSDLKHILLAN